MTFRHSVYRFNWRCWNTNETKSKHIIFFIFFRALKCEISFMPRSPASKKPGIRIPLRLDATLVCAPPQPTSKAQPSPAQPSFLNANCCKNGLIVGWVTLSLLVYTKGIG